MPGRKKAKPAANAAPAITRQSSKTRVALVKQFIETVIFGQYRQLVAWQTVTGQSSQFDSGYLAQQLVSLLTGIPGKGRRGKGEDLADSSEVKAASTISGVDVPRWNNFLRNPANRKTYLSRPALFFVLFDTLDRGKPFPFRVRVWKVEPRTDLAFRKVVERWAKTESSGNLQLHPPCWRPDNIVRNEAGNLDFPLMFLAEQQDIGDVDYMEIKSVNLNPGPCRIVPR